MYSIDARVRYSEVNSEKQLTLPALLDYLQDCCTFQSEDFGVGVDYLQKEQAAWVLSSWQIKIERYPQMGEKIKVSTWPYEFKGFYGRRNFLITDENGGILAKADSVWVFMDMQRMRPGRITEAVAAAYADELAEPISDAWSVRKIKVPENGRKKTPVQVAKYHIDTNHHVNNAKYVLLAEEFLPDDFVISGIHAEYKKAAVLGDTLYPTVVTEEEQAWVVLGDENGAPYAVIQFFRK